MRAGLAMYFEIIDRPDAQALVARLVAALELDWFVNVQFIGEHLLEINPRISTIVYQDDLNLPWLAVRRALGEITDDERARRSRPADADRPPRHALLRAEQPPSTRDRPATTGSDRPPGRALIRTPSARSRSRCSRSHPGTRPPDALTTRCAGSAPSAARHDAADRAGPPPAGPAHSAIRP